MAKQAKDKKKTSYMKGTLVTLETIRQVANLYFESDTKAAAKAIENKFK